MKKLVFATNNLHKLSEIRSMLAGKIEVLSLADIDCHDEIEETADTLEGNALIKARHVYEHYHHYCFADDTGLFVDSLDGAPGVWSARYAGEHCSPEDNMAKLLSALEGKEERQAAFRTVIVLIDAQGEHLFEGRVEGDIVEQRSGREGFGYDPIFRPVGYDETFAEMDAEAKNAISHRGRAIEKLVTYLLAQ